MRAASAPARRYRGSEIVPVDVARILVVGAIAVLLAVVASNAFDRMEWPLLVSPCVTTVAAVVVRKRSLVLRLAMSAAAVITGVVVAGVWAGARDAGELVGGLFEGPRRLLTTEWPSPADPQIVVALAVMLGLVSAVGVDLAGRRDLHVLPLLPPAIGLAGAIAISAPRRPDALLLWTIAALAIVLLLLPHGERVSARLRTLVGERALPIVLVSLVVAGVASSTAVAWSDRADPRRIQDADVTVTVLAPIEEMIALRDAEPPFGVFRITDRSTLIGRSLPARWRIAALTEYDGQRWVPSLTLRPIGTRLGMPRPASPDQAPPIAFDVELLTDDFDLVPLPGQPLLVDSGSSRGVQTDADRTVVRLAERSRPGRIVRVTSDVAPRLERPATAGLAARQVDEISAEFVDVAETIAPDGTLVERLIAIEQTLRGWGLDSGSSGGLQLALMERFVTETRRGTEEQFVTAFVLLARSIGVDARIAAGFVVPPDELRAPLELRSTHAAVWPEVRLEGLGWLAFNPAPSSESGDAEPPPPPPEAQTPAAAQPPIPPPADRANDEPTVDIDRGEGSSTWSTIRGWLVRASVGGGAAVLPFVVVMTAILAIKGLRRQRRLRRADPARRIVGAWANTTDALIDAGLTIGHAWTDARIAETAEPYAGTAPEEVRRLAALASAMTFGPTTSAGTIVDHAVSTAKAVEAAIAAAMSRRQRLRWRLSPRSLRRATRSPVVV